MGVVCVPQPTGAAWSGAGVEPRGRLALSLSEAGVDTPYMYFAV